MSSRRDGASTDLSAARWRAARIRTATSNLVAPFGLRPSSGQLSGHGGDRLHSAIHRGEFPADGEQQPVRVLLPTDPATTLLAAPTAAVGISGNGLHLLRRHITLTGWRSTERGLLLTTPAGERHLGPAALNTQQLRCIGRDAPQIELCRVPLSDLLAPVLGALTEFITVQLGSAENLFVTTS